MLFSGSPCRKRRDDNAKSEAEIPAFAAGKDKTSATKNPLELRALTKKTPPGSSPKSCAGRRQLYELVEGQGGGPGLGGGLLQKPLTAETSHSRNLRLVFFSSPRKTSSEHYPLPSWASHRRRAAHCAAGSQAHAGEWAAKSFSSLFFF